MIGVEGQYRASFSLRELKDFLIEEQLILFKAVEEVGNVLPVYELIIEIMDELVLKYLNEGNVITVALGKTKDDMEETYLIPTKVTPNKIGEHKYQIRIVGIFHKMNYLTDRKVSITDKLKSTDAIKKVVSPYFEFETNVSASDTMNWIQPNTTDKAFVSHIWKHSYIPGSFPAIAITIKGIFRYLDLKKVMQDPYKFRFVDKKEKENDILFEAGYSVNNASTFLNQIAGYGKKQLVANLEDGTFTLLQQNPAKPSLALSDKIQATSDIAPRYDAHTYQSADNVHPFFWKAKLQNAINLFTMTSVKVSLFFHNQFHKVKPLDLVYFKEEEPLSQKTTSSETLTGLYFITKTSRIIENKTYKTYVEIVRETPNSIRGKLGETE